MRIYHPAVGTIGYYAGTDLGMAGSYDKGQFPTPLNLISTDVCEPPADGYILVAPPDPEAIGTVNPFTFGAETFTWAVFFPGIDPEFVPTVWSNTQGFPI